MYAAGLYPVQTVLPICSFFYFLPSPVGAAAACSEIALCSICSILSIQEIETSKFTLRSSASAEKQSGGFGAMATTTVYHATHPRSRVVAGPHHANERCEHSG